jgi:hypothetical protein
MGSYAFEAYRDHQAELGGNLPWCGQGFPSARNSHEFLSPWRQVSGWYAKQVLGCSLQIYHTMSLRHIKDTSRISCSSQMI